MCVRACLYVCAGARVRACVRACVCVCVCVRASDVEIRVIGIRQGRFISRSTSLQNVRRAKYSVVGLCTLQGR